MQYKDESKLFVRFLKENNVYEAYTRYFHKYVPNRTLALYLNRTAPINYMNNLYYLKYEWNYGVWKKTNNKWKKLLRYKKLKEKHLAFLYPLTNLRIESLYFVIYIFAIGLSIYRGLDIELDKVLNTILFISVILITALVLWAFMMLLHTIVYLQCGYGLNSFKNGWNETKKNFKDVIFS